MKGILTGDVRGYDLKDSTCIIGVHSNRLSERFPAAQNGFRSMTMCGLCWRVTRLQ